MNAHNLTNSSEMNAASPFLGLFPERRDAALSEVLRRPVDGAVMTGVNAVFDASQTHQRQDVITYQGALGRANSNIGKRLTAREFRVLTALWNSKGWIWREEIDRVAGASNGPHIIMMLRTKVTGHQGLEMERVPSIDRDGKPCNPGRYRLNELGCQRVRESGVLSEVA